MTANLQTPSRLALAAGAGAADVYVGISAAAVAIQGHPCAWSQHEDISSGVEHTLALARKELRSWRPRARVWLSGALIRPFLFGPVSGLSTWNEATLAARSAAPEAAGFDDACDVWLDDWPAPKPVLAVALQRSTVALVTGAAARAGIHLESLRPWWAQAIDDARGRGALVAAAQDPDALTVVGASAASSWTLAHSHVPGPTSAQVRPSLDRLMLSHGVDEAAVHFAELKFQGPWHADEAKPKQTELTTS